MFPGMVSSSSCTSGYVIGYVCKWIDTDVAMIHSSKQKLEQHETHKKWCQVNNASSQVIFTYSLTHITYNITTSAGGTAYHSWEHEFMLLNLWQLIWHSDESKLYCVYHRQDIYREDALFTWHHFLCVSCCSSFCFELCIIATSVSVTSHCSLRTLTLR
jgi:hypothetical protein